jgi:hypothetical protein
MRVSEAEKNAVIDRGFSETGTEDEKREELMKKSARARPVFHWPNPQREWSRKNDSTEAKKSPPARSIFGPSEARHADAIPHQKETR